MSIITIFLNIIKISLIDTILATSTTIVDTNSTINITSIIDTISIINIIILSI